MSTVQSFLASTTEKAVSSLIEAFERIPTDKREWIPMGNSRSAINQAAEIAILNGSTVDLLTDRKMPDDFDFNKYYAQRNRLADKGWDAVKALLEDNTKRAVAAIEAIPDTDVDTVVSLPWGDMTLTQLAAYPYWNMSYHEGQINYIASMLDGSG